MSNRQDRISQLFDIIGESFTPDSRSMDTFITHCLSDEEIKDKTILDVGCGTGVACMFLAGMKASYIIGLDISDRSLEQAVALKDKNSLHNVYFQKGDLLQLPFSDNSFDVVISIGALPYLWDFYRALDEMARVLKKDGILLLLLLKRTRYDIFYEFARELLSCISLKYALACARILSVILYPFKNIFLKRSINIYEGKKLEHILLEVFFVPVKHMYHDPQVIKRYLDRRQITVDFLPVPVLSFCCPETVFIVKGRKET